MDAIVTENGVCALRKEWMGQISGQTVSHLLKVHSSRDGG